MLALVDAASRARSASCGAPGARPSGSARRSTRSGCASPGSKLTDEEQVALAALRRLAVVLGAHFLEEEGDELVDDRAAGRLRARHDVRVRRHARREPQRARSCSGSLVSRARPRAPGRRHPRGREPRRPAGAGRAMSGIAVALLVAVVALAVALAVVLVRRRPPSARPSRDGARRILVPFSGQPRPDRARRGDPHRPRRGRGARARLPADRAARSTREDSPLRDAGEAARCRCSRRSSTPRCAPASRSTRGSRRGGR